MDMHEMVLTRLRAEHPEQLDTFAADALEICPLIADPDAALLATIQQATGLLVSFRDKWKEGRAGGVPWFPLWVGAAIRGTEAALTNGEITTRYRISSGVPLHDDLIPAITSGAPVQITARGIAIGSMIYEGVQLVERAAPGAPFDPVPPSTPPEVPEAPISRRKRPARQRDWLIESILIDMARGAYPGSLTGSDWISLYVEKSSTTTTPSESTYNRAVREARDVKLLYVDHGSPEAISVDRHKRAAEFIKNRPELLTKLSDLVRKQNP